MKFTDLNDGKHVNSIIARETCTKHSAGLGIACYMIMADTSGIILNGVCNSRAKRAGARGHITPSSYQTKSRKFGNKKQ